MAKKSEKQITSPEEIHVKLKPLFGIKPGTYLTVLYSVIILLIVFLLLFLPGIRKYGSVVTFYTVPGGADVYIDGHYVGGSPVTTFVSAGEHEITLVKGFYRSRSFTARITGRLFGSILFPKRTIVARGLVLEDPWGYAAAGYADFSSWSLIHSPHIRYQLPPILSTAVEDIFASRSEDAAEVSRSLLEASMGFSANETTLSDLVQAASLIETEGRSLLPQTVPGLLGEIARFQSRHPGFALWLEAQLGESKSRQITGTEWFNAFPGGFGAESTEEGGGDRFVSLAGLPFVFVPGGSRMTSPFEDRPENKVLHSYRSMYVMTREVTYRDFSRFLDDVPRWRPENRDALVEEGLVTEDYLAGWEESRDTDLPVRFVSYYAAVAFCDWLGSVLPSGFSGFRATLPNEYQWEAAASASDMTDPVLHEPGIEGPFSARDPAVLGDFYGNLWEWCGNDFKRNDGISFDSTGRYIPSPDGFSSAEKAVRGGSWASIPELVTVTSRGSQPAEWCTPFLGFRVILQGSE
ncbi:MAG: SUMF1/EgtB/PvdO family nonheme iron enzyme [Spirochaetia bacterium]